MKALYSQMKSDHLVSGLVEIADPTPQEREVKIKVEYSSVNYKDALGVTGKGQIFKKLPIVGGIDAAGTVIDSRSSKFKAGDAVLVTGCNLGETHDGGYSELLVESENSIVARPNGLTARQAMTFGTAGFTAALALERMSQNGQKPAMGPILVTGASGGVGQFAIYLFSRAGYEVHALTGKTEMREPLYELGAKKVLLPRELPPSSRPLEKVQYGGLVDNLGGETLAKLMAQIQLWGNIACIGLAEGAELHTTVMPMILRGVSLLGISSNNCQYDLRLKIWQRLAAFAADVERFVTREIELGDILNVANEMLERKTHGRILVKISG